MITWDRDFEIEIGKALIISLCILGAVRIIYFLYILYLKNRKDKCENCQGSRGGVRGNENIVDGKILCDNCIADTMSNKERP